MTREEIMQLNTDYLNDCESEHEMNELFYYVLELQKQMQEPRWIPVSEKLPEENEYIGDVCKYYLIQDEYGDMHVAHLSKVGWKSMDSLKAIGDEVIAWMPLPEPYKKGAEE